MHFGRAMKKSIAVLSLIFCFAGCNEDELIERYKNANPTKSWTGPGGVTISTSHSDRRVVINRGGSKTEVSLGSKWQWVLPDHIKVESNKYLIIPVQYCSQLRWNDENSYKIYLVSLPNGDTKKEFVIRKESWEKLQLPLCSYPSLSEKAKAIEDDA